MKTVLRLAIPALLALSPLAAAEWEGVVEMKIVDEDGLTGTARVQKSHGSTRARVVTTSPEMERAGYGPFDLTVVSRGSEPGVRTFVNSERRLYSKDRSETPRAPGPAGPGGTWTVRKLGTGRVAGLECEMVLLSRQRPEVVREFCVSREIASSPADRFVLSTADRYGEVDSALDAIGLEGLALRVVAVTKESPGSKTLLEVLRAEPRPIPASVFAIPAGYRVTSPADAMVSGREAKRVEELVKGLTPAQRRLFEKMTGEAGSPPK